MLAVTYSDGSRTRIDDPSTATAFEADRFNHSRTSPEKPVVRQ